MRPQILYPLFASISSVSGIGPRYAKLYEKLCGPYLAHLLWHLPIGHIDRSYSPTLKAAEAGKIATLTLKVLAHSPPHKKSHPYKILCTDETAHITLTFFNVKGDYLSKLYPINEHISVSGILEKYQHEWTMPHPDYCLPVARKAEIPRLEAVYPLTAGLSNKVFRKTLGVALAKTPMLPEWQDPALLKRENWPDWKTALYQAHTQIPPSEGRHAARERLAYDELLADQLALAILRQQHKRKRGLPLSKTQTLHAQLEQLLPFKLTNAQNMAIAEISADLSSDYRMLRLLQGDVGSGKTVVALYAMLQAIESGTQAALMAPTEILAKQHQNRLNHFLETLGYKAALLTGRSKNNETKELLLGLEDGTLPIVIGTHALFQDAVKFKNLGLVVVDEQHRFGVQQRLQLAEKGQGTNILVMTATPIPRTLALTAYGDMDVSRLNEKPLGRQPIDTRLIDTARIEEVIASVKRHLATGAQAYWVCPLIEENENLDIANATARFQALHTALAPFTVGLIHGRLATDEKEHIMTAFSSGEIKLLVATTVIEVGVDVQNATLMIIEHAERFGLAQLHQLRGRVGRGSEKSTCLLLYQKPLGHMAKARLKLLKETEDGFFIAEEDLKLRGSGEILGTKQSGLPLFKLANCVQNQNLLEIAHTESRLILNKDPDLSSPRGQNLRTLLYLFEKDQAVKLFHSG